MAIIDKGKYTIERIKTGDNKQYTLARGEIKIAGKDETFNIDLYEVSFNVTISVTPSDAKIEVMVEDGVLTGNKFNLKKGSYQYRITKEGYDTISDRFEIVDKDITLNKTLEKKKFRLTINPIPTDAKVEIKRSMESVYKETKFALGETGTVFQYKVSKSGYTTKSGSITMGNTDESMDIELTKVNSGGSGGSSGGGGQSGGGSGGSTGPSQPGGGSTGGTTPTGEDIIDGLEGGNLGAKIVGSGPHEVYITAFPLDSVLEVKIRNTVVYRNVGYIILKCNIGDQVTAEIKPTKEQINRYNPSSDNSNGSIFKDSLRLTKIVTENLYSMSLHLDYRGDSYRTRFFYNEFSLYSPHTFKKKIKTIGNNAYDMYIVPVNTTEYLPHKDEYANSEWYYKYNSEDDTTLYIFGWRRIVEGNIVDRYTYTDESYTTYKNKILFGFYKIKLVDKSTKKIFKEGMVLIGDENPIIFDFTKADDNQSSEEPQSENKLTVTVSNPSSDYKVFIFDGTTLSERSEISLQSPKEVEVIIRADNYKVHREYVNVEGVITKDFSLTELTDDDNMFELVADQFPFKDYGFKEVYTDIKNNNIIFMHSIKDGQVSAFIYEKENKYNFLKFKVNINGTAFDFFLSNKVDGYRNYEVKINKNVKKNTSFDDKRITITAVDGTNKNRYTIFKFYNSSDNDFDNFYMNYKDYYDHDYNITNISNKFLTYDKNNKNSLHVLETRSMDDYRLFHRDYGANISFNDKYIGYYSEDNRLFTLDDSHIIIGSTDYYFNHDNDAHYNESYNPNNHSAIVLKIDYTSDQDFTSKAPPNANSERTSAFLNSVVLKLSNGYFIIIGYKSKSDKKYRANLYTSRNGQLILAQADCIPQDVLNSVRGGYTHFKESGGVADSMNKYAFIKPKPNECYVYKLQGNKMVFVEKVTAEKKVYVMYTYDESNKYIYEINNKNEARLRIFSAR